ncbi:hypothetical protein Tco_0353400 [Tanacetum coccineum]
MQCRERRWKALFPHIASLLKKARDIQKCSTPSNFVDREEECPTLRIFLGLYFESQGSRLKANKNKIILDNTKQAYATIGFILSAEGEQDIRDAFCTSSTNALMGDLRDTLLACKEINVGGDIEELEVKGPCRYRPGYRDSDYGVGVGGHHHVEEPGFKGTTRV